MGVGLRIWDASSKLVFDTEDRVVGGLVEFSTGTASGSRTITPEAGQAVDFVYQLPGAWRPSGTASRWPGFIRSGNTLSWSFNSSVPAGDRTPVGIIAVTW